MTNYLLIRVSFKRPFLNFVEEIRFRMKRTLPPPAYFLPLPLVTTSGNNSCKKVPSGRYSGCFLAIPNNPSPAKSQCLIVSTWPKRLYFTKGCLACVLPGNMFSCVFCLATCWRGTAAARGGERRSDAASTLGSLNLPCQQRETLRGGSGSLLARRGCTNPQLPSPFPCVAINPS